jgi:hypothetical protein
LRLPLALLFFVVCTTSFAAATDIEKLAESIASKEYKKIFTAGGSSMEAIKAASAMTGKFVTRKKGTPADAGKAVATVLSAAHDVDLDKAAIARAAGMAAGAVLVEESTNLTPAEMAKKKQDTARYAASAAAKAVLAAGGTKIVAIQTAGYVAQSVDLANAGSAFEAVRRVFAC